MNDLAKLTIAVESQDVLTAKQRLQGLERQGGLTEARMLAFGAAAQRTGRMLTMGLTLPILGFGVMAVKTAADFESSMNRVRAITNATEAEFRQLNNLARELGATTKFSAQEAAEGMAFLSMAGFEVNQVIGAMPGLLDLASAGQLDLARAADIASNVLQGFRLEVSQTGQVVDVLAATSSSANTDIEQLGLAMSYAAPISAGLGVSIEMAASAIGALSDAGIQGSRAGRSFMQVLIQLTSEADKMGVNLYDAQGNMRNFGDIIDDIAAKGFRTAEIMDMFGARAGPALEILLDRGGEGLRRFATDLEGAGGTAERMSKQQMEGLKGSILELRSAFQELQLVFTSGGLLDDVTKLTRGLTEKLRAFANLEDTTRRNIITLSLYAAAAGPILMVVGKLTTTAIRATHAVRGLTVAMMAHPYVAAGVAVTGLTVALIRYVRTQQDVNYGASDTVRNLKEQQIEFNTLVQRITQVNQGEEKRKELLDELKNSFPDYIQGVDTSTVSNQELAKALKEVNEEMARKILVQRQEERVSQAERRHSEALANSYEAEARILMRLNRANQEHQLGLNLTNRTQEEAIRLVGEALQKRIQASTLQGRMFNRESQSLYELSQLQAGYRNSLAQVGQTERELAKIREYQEGVMGSLGEATQKQTGFQDEIVDSVDQLIQENQELIDSWEEMTEWINKGSIRDLQNQIKALAGPMMDATDPDVVRKYLKEIDNLERAIANLKGELKPTVRETYLDEMADSLDELIKKNQEFQRGLKIEEWIEPGSIRGINLEIQRLTHEMERFTDPVKVQQYAAEIEALRKKIQELMGETQKANNTARELSWAFQSAFENAIISGNNLRSVIQGLIDDMLRLALRAAVTQPLANWFSASIVGTSGTPQKVNDALIMKDGKVIQPSSDDHILAMKDFSPLLRGQDKSSPANVSINVNVNNTLSEEGIEVHTDQRDRGDGTVDIEMVVVRTVVNDIVKGGLVAKALQDTHGIRRIGRRR